MTRQIQVTDNVTLGYYFSTKEFFLTNRKSQTTRGSLRAIKNLLDLTVPNHEITPLEIEMLASEPESLTSVGFAWGENGSHVHSLQFNDYADHLLLLDTNTRTMSIKGSNIVFDLTLTEGKLFRLQRIQAYYRDNVGLEISMNDLILLYDFLFQYYKPHAYNVIGKGSESNKLMYTYNLNLLDATNTCQAHYSCTLNPNSKFTPIQIADVTNMQDNYIKVLSLPVTLPNTLYVQGTTKQGNQSNDGKYTLDKIDQDSNTIYIHETLPLSYTVEPTALYLCAYTCNVLKMSRATSTIQLATPIPTSILVGDKIQVRNATILTEYEEISLDGTYTISKLDTSTNTIYVEEEIKTDYTYRAGTYPTLFKPLYIGNITHVLLDYTITLDKNIPYTLQTGNKLLLQTSTNSMICTIKELEEPQTAPNELHITCEEYVQDFDPPYAQLQKGMPEEIVEITVTDSQLPEQLKDGTFIQDTIQQAIQYIGLIPTLPKPTETMFRRMGDNIQDTMYIGLEHVEYMDLLGMYNEVY